MKVADISYIPTWTGFLYLAVVLDVFSRRIVGPLAPESHHEFSIRNEQITAH
jgi:transposase InsO family protein